MYSNPTVEGQVAGLSPFLPPAPTPQPKPLGVFALLRTLRKNPLECFALEHFEKPIAPGGVPLAKTLLVHEPTAIRHVLLDNADNYRKDLLQRRVLSAGMAEGLLSVEGAQWQMQRRSLAPLFAHRTVTGFAPQMLSAAATLVERWSGSRTIDIAAEMRELTLDVLHRTIFPDGLGGDARQLRTAMAVYFDTIGKIDPLDLFGVPDFIPRISQWRVRPTLRFFEAAVEGMIDARRSSEDESSEPFDILTRLLKAVDPETGAPMTPSEIKSNILTFISAGHETTANALTWSLYLLSQSDHWRERVEAEVDREFERGLEGLADRLVMTRAVIEEAIRLYPPIAAISRVADNEDELAGVKVERGTLVVIAPYVLHRHRTLWDRPDEFDPSRFLGPARRKIDRFAYLPFGVGPRTCIGSVFALQEATLVLAAIAHRYRLSLAPDCNVTPLLRVTLRPANGLQMVIEPRNRGKAALSGDGREETASARAATA